MVCCDPHIQSLSEINEPEVDVFLEFPCFIYDPMNVGNLISGSSFLNENSLTHITVFNSMLHFILIPEDMCVCVCVCVYIYIYTRGIR